MDYLPGKRTVRAYQTMKPELIFPLCLLILCSLAQAKEYVWLIGGGPELANSQAQIELNTKWVQELLQKHKTLAITKTYFTDGSNPESDVKLQIEIEETNQNLQPLARVFSEKNANATQYYSHTVDNVYGSTDSQLIQKDLANDFKQLNKNDSVMLIFQGHGGINPRDTAKNSLKLWNDSRLTVIQLEQLLQQLNPQVPVRFIFPQCFSGGFSRLIYSQADNRLEPSSRTRCGFMAEYDYEESEGCTTSINEADYRDYTTYFFAALDGKSRDDKHLTANPDRDNNGQVSLREAHFYSLTEAISTDIPRSTSETFLDNWTPWYLRWIGDNTIPDNIYSELAKDVAENNQFILKSNGQVNELKGLINDLELRRHSLSEKNNELIKTIEQLKEKISAQVTRKWPYIRFTNTKNYFELLKTQLSEIQNFIRKQDDYPRLFQAQEQEPLVKRELLEVKRKITQLQKINRLNQLSRVLAHFNQRASEKDKAVYEKLVKCESLPF